MIRYGVISELCWNKLESAGEDLPSGSKEQVDFKVKQTFDDFQIKSSYRKPCHCLLEVKIFTKVSCSSAACLTAVNSAVNHFCHCGIELQEDFVQDNRPE